MPSASVAAHLAALMILITSGMASANLHFSASIESPDGPINTSQYPIDSNILYLLDIYNQPELDDSGITNSFDEEGIAISLRFNRELVDTELDMLDSLGVVVDYIQLEGFLMPAIMNQVCIVHIDPDIVLESLISLSDSGIGGGLLWAESTYYLSPSPTMNQGLLDQNIADAHQELFYGIDGFETPLPVMGDGTTIALIDDGIDVFHPIYWNPDGASFDWIDINQNGGLTPGLDVVDLDSDGQQDNNELLRYIDSDKDSSFTLDVDWLYADLNLNGERDFGVDSGFTESDPSYGEPLFWFSDTDSDGIVDLGEQLIRLGESKIRAYSSSSENEYLRGVDLIESPRVLGHGNGMASILVGGVEGRKHMGVAPEADLLIGNPYGQAAENALMWTAFQNPDVIIHEFGNYGGGVSLDGSTNYEHLVDDSSENLGIINIIPSGNMGSISKHAYQDVTSSGESFIIDVPESRSGSITSSFQWLGTWFDPSAELTTPNGQTIQLTFSGSQDDGAGISIWSGLTETQRGNERLDLYIYGPNGILQQGEYELEFTSNSPITEVHGWMRGPWGHWSEGIRFLSPSPSNQYTTCYPATSDWAIGVAGYQTPDWSAPFYYAYSGQGPRIDGHRTVDVTAITGVVIAGGGYGEVSASWGTSPAGPFVAGAAALFAQVNGNASGPSSFWESLNESSRTDQWTGQVPNHKWGSGKLNAHELILADYVPPISYAGEDLEIYPGTASLSGEGRDNLRPNLLSFSWEVSGPGFDAFESPGADLNLELNQTGTYRAWLSVTDEIGRVDIDEVIIIVVNSNPPTADAGFDIVSSVYEPVTISANASHDDIDVVSYDWDIDGIGSLSGSSHNIRFDAPGTYEARLTVSDYEGQTDTDTIMITSVNLPPQVEADYFLNSSTIDFHWNVEDENPNATLIQLVTPVATLILTTTEGERSVDISLFGEGQFEFILQTTDEFGEINFELMEITIDFLPPSPIFKSPAYLIDDSVLLRWFPPEVEDIQGYEIFLDGRWITTLTETQYDFVLHNLSTGQHNVSLRIYDYSDQFSEANLSFTIETEEESDGDSNRFDIKTVGVMVVASVVLLLICAATIVTRRKTTSGSPSHWSLVEDESEQGPPPLPPPPSF